MVYYSTEHIQQEKDRNMTGLISDLMRRLNQFADMDTKVNLEMKEDFSDHCEQFSKWAEDNRAHVLQQSGKLGEFWESTYLVDRPSGATPQRKAYDYPKHLSATSPHEKIIMRYMNGLKEDKMDEPTNELF